MGEGKEQRAGKRLSVEKKREREDRSMHTETKVRIYRSQAEAAVGAIEAILVGV